MALAGLAVIAAIVYGLVAKELAGAVMLGVFSVALLYIATVLEHAGPYDHAENEPEAKAEVGPSHLFPSSWWPILMATGAVLFLIGLKFNVVLMALGAVLFFSAMLGWFVQAGRQAAARQEHHSTEGAGHP